MRALVLEMIRLQRAHRVFGLAPNVHRAARSIVSHVLLGTVESSTSHHSERRLRHLPHITRADRKGTRAGNNEARSTSDSASTPEELAAAAPYYPVYRIENR